jgi:hypothetical protein
MYYHVVKRKVSNFNVFLMKTFDFLHKYIGIFLTILRIGQDNKSPFCCDFASAKVLQLSILHLYPSCKYIIIIQKLAYTCCTECTVKHCKHRSKVPRQFIKYHSLSTILLKISPVPVPTTLSL